MALILSYLIGCRNQCNTKKLGFLGSHLTRHHHHHHHHLIPSSWSFSTTTTGTTTLPVERNPDEHHRRGGIHTSIINERPAVDSTKTKTKTTLPKDEHCLETLTLGGGLGDLGGATVKQRDAQMNHRVKSLARFAAFAIGDAENLDIEFKKLISGKVQLLRNGRFYSFNMELLDNGIQKFYEAHVLDTLIESNSVSLKDWCKLKSAPPGWLD